MANETAIAAWIKVNEPAFVGDSTVVVAVVAFADVAIVKPVIACQDANPFPLEDYR